MGERLAILDLGTNTFHLLIIEVRENKQFDILYKTERFVKLAEESITHIGNNAFERGITLLKEYNEVMHQYRPLKIFASGTAALRRADNAKEFIAEVLAQTGIEVKVISGDEEAGLIYKGVRRAVPLSDELALIMDIGGGSTEFIIANRHHITWKQSFPVGASVLKQRFHHTEPITEKEKHTLIHFLQQELAPLFAELNKHAVHYLIGASGSFDSYASMIAHKYYSPEILNGKTHFDMKREELLPLFAELEKANYEQRLQIPGLLTFRAEMITVAAILTEVILEHAPIYRISSSAYALKEGVIAEITS